MTAIGRVGQRAVMDLPVLGEERESLDQRVQAIMATIRTYCPESTCLDRERIVAFCEVAERESARLPKGKTDKIHKDKALRNRAMLIGSGGQQFLLLTCVKNGKDTPLGCKGAWKDPKFAVDLRTGEIKIVGVLKETKFSPLGKWKKVKAAAISEIEMMSACQDIPEVVRLDLSHIDFSPKGEKIYLVMKYCEEGDLIERMIRAKEEPLSEEERTRWLLEITRGLAAIHQKGILHKDLTSMNIFLTEGHAKIGDFGYAARKESAAIEPGCYTLSYTAPEVESDKTASVYTDAWSLGCTIFLLLAEGVILEPEDGAFGRQQKFFDEGLRRYVSEAHSRYKPLLRGLLSVDPEQRWTVQKFYEELLKVLKPETLSERKEVSCVNSITEERGF